MWVAFKKRCCVLRIRYFMFVHFRIMNETRLRNMYLLFKKKNQTEAHHKENCEYSTQTVSFERKTHDDKIRYVLPVNSLEMEYLFGVQTRSTGSGVMRT